MPGSETANMQGKVQLTSTPFYLIALPPLVTITPGKDMTTSFDGSPSKKQRKVQTVIMPVTKIAFWPPLEVTPDKEELTLSQACRGWTGSQYKSLFRQSLTEFSYSAKMSARPLHVFGLSSVYASLKTQVKFFSARRRKKDLKSGLNPALEDAMLLTTLTAVFLYAVFALRFLSKPFLQLRPLMHRNLWRFLQQCKLPKQTLQSHHPAVAWRFLSKFGKRRIKSYGMNVGVEVECRNLWIRACCADQQWQQYSLFCDANLGSCCSVHRKIF